MGSAPPFPSSYYCQCKTKYLFFNFILKFKTRRPYTQLHTMVDWSHPSWIEESRVCRCTDSPIVSTLQYPWSVKLPVLVRLHWYNEWSDSSCTYELAMRYHPFVLQSLTLIDTCLWCKLLWTYFDMMQYMHLNIIRIYGNTNVEARLVLLSILLIKILCDICNSLYYLCHS